MENSSEKMRSYALEFFNTMQTQDVLPADVYVQCFANVISEPRAFLTSVKGHFLNEPHVTKRYSKSPEVCYLFDRVPALHPYKTDGFCQYAVLSDGKVIEVDLARKNSGEVIAVARYAHVSNCYDECETPSESWERLLLTKEAQESRINEALKFGALWQHEVGYNPAVDFSSVLQRVRNFAKRGGLY